jgi:hypothetical protein
MRHASVICALLLVLVPGATRAEPVDEDQLGAWYMYYWGTRLEDSRWGFQGDGQYRNWDLGGDLEQLLLRAGVTYTPASNDVTFTLGYGNITSGAFGDDNATSREDRIYQEMLIPQKLGSRVHLRHRFRFEQRWVEDQDFRTRFRYNLFADIPINREDLGKGAIYVALHNEIFINGERDIGDGRTVEQFDRNRLYGAIGYGLTDRMKVQVGYMQQTTDLLSKGQLQVSFHHSF